MNARESLEVVRPEDNDIGADGNVVDLGEADLVRVVRGQADPGQHLGPHIDLADRTHLPPRHSIARRKRHEEAARPLDSEPDRQGAGIGFRSQIEALLVEFLTPLLVDPIARGADEHEVAGAGVQSIANHHADLGPGIGDGLVCHATGD